MKKKNILSKEYKLHHTEDQCSTLGNIILDDIFTEDTIGNTLLYNTGLVKIKVFTNEGTIPHFHLEKSDGTFICCICLHTNKYFHHKGIKKEELSSKQRKDLYNFLKSTNKDTGMSYYETMKIVWNSSTNNLHKVNLNTKIPDYLSMKESIHE